MWRLCRRHECTAVGNSLVAGGEGGPERRRGVVLLTNGANGFLPMIPVAQLLSRGTPFEEFLGTGE